MNKETQNSGTINLDALKDYRKKQNISIETAADGMKVSKDYIRYIEAGHFEKLGAPTFLRGHITNYCKVLG
ncbi:MAG: helix-turn-helix domain-containing protein, partial [Marinicella sp.]